MKECRFQLTYIADGQLHRTCGKAQEQQPFETEHFSLMTQYEKGRVRVRILPKEPVSFTQFEMVFRYPYQPDSRVFVNGYQSWTDSKEYFVTDRMTHLSPLSKAWIKEMSLDKSGDYTFHDYPKTSGVFHGYSYSYVRNGETVDLFGSMTERGGYTIFNFDCNRNLLIVEKDLEGVVMEEPYEAVDIVHLRGGFDQVFDRYFQLMEIPKPRVQHKCGYTTWYNYYPHINEKIVTDDLEALAKVPEQIDIFQIDDGYQTAVGDWLSTDPEKFPNGMKAVADQIHSKGMLAGLWLAPFGCEYHSTIAEKHPEWLIKNEKGKPVVAGLNCGGFYAIDFNHPEAAQYIRNCFDVILNEWGYDMVKLDFLYAACILPQYNKSRGQLMCEAMDFIRDCVGDKLILGCGVPLAPCYGKVDFCRIGADVCLDWKPTLHGYLTHREDATTKNAVNNTIFRRQLDGRAFCNDPDVFLLRDYNMQLNMTQRKIIAKVNKIFGNLLFISDNVDSYDAEQMAVFQDTLKTSDTKVLSAEYVKKDVVEVRFLEDGVEKHLRFNITDGALLEGEF